MTAPTKSQVNRAGRTMRRWMRGEIDLDPDQDSHDLFPRSVDRALNVILAHRAAHQYPLVKANMGLRSAVKSEHCRIEVSQRLKRMTTIVDKLTREPTMALANMQDIGGCRAVLDSIDEIHRVERRLRKNRPVLGSDDYITTPRSSGYRGVHVVVGYSDEDGKERAIEVQLRTRLMHEWAIQVERYGGRLNIDLKSGEGPPEVLSILELISEAMAHEERGETVPAVLLDRIRNLRPAALRYLGGPT